MIFAEVLVFELLVAFILNFFEFLCLSQQIHIHIFIKQRNGRTDVVKVASTIEH